MRNDVNKRPKRPGDLAALLAATPPEDHDFLQGVVLTMNLTTGANSVDMGGGITQSNCLVVGDPAAVPAGTVVFMIRVRRRYYILGPISDPPNPLVFRFSQRLIFRTPGVGSFDPDTYPGLRGILVTTIGGGGAGGGCAAVTTTTNRSCGGGGGAGGWAQQFLPLAAISNPTSYTVGAAGAAAAGATGGTGGASFFDSGVCLGNGGIGGISSTATTTTIFARGGAGGDGMYADLIVPGGPGVTGCATQTGSSQVGGPGGSSQWGAGGYTNSSTGAGPGVAGRGIGGGGSGAQAGGGTLAAQSGGAGAAGGVIIDIYV